jgi:hypothetical protein
MFDANDVREFGDEIGHKLFEVNCNGLPMQFVVSSLIVFIRDKWRKVHTIEPVKTKIKVCGCT